MSGQGPREPRHRQGWLPSCGRDTHRFLPQGRLWLCLWHWGLRAGGGEWGPCSAPSSRPSSSRPCATALVQAGLWVSSASQTPHPLWKKCPCSHGPWSPAWPRVVTHPEGAGPLQGHSGQGSLLTPRPGRFPPPCVLTFGGGRGPWHHLPDVPRALGSGPLAGVGASMEGVVVASSPATG